MAGESLNFPITAEDRASSKFRDVGRAAGDAGAKIDFAAGSLKLWNDTAARSAKADATLVQSRQAHAKADKLLADAENVLAGKATSTTKLFADQQRKMDDTAKSATGLAARFAGLAGTGGGGVAAGAGMGALIGAGTALAGQITTLGFGFGGLALAAYGVAKPIEKAAQATGGLRKNLHTLNPEQQAVARSLLSLGHEYDAFQKALQPQILTAFNDGFRIAGHLLHDVQPVAAATGKAFDQVLLSIDKTFQSGTWQQFFTWMAQQAGPDVQALGKTFTDLLQALPPLIQDLNPLGKALLLVADDAAKATGGIAHFYAAFQRNVPISNEHSINFLKDLDHWTVELTNHLGPWARAINNSGTSVQRSLGDTGTAAEKMARSQYALGGDVHAATMTMAGQAKQLNILAGGYKNALTPLGNYISAEITQRNDLKTLTDNLKKSHDAIGLKTQAERNSFQSAQQYIQDTLHQGDAALAAHKGIDAQITSIEQALPKLDQVKNKTAAYKQELKLLKGVLDKLRQERNIHESVSVSGAGTWSLSQPGGKLSGPTGTASGWLVSGGSPGRDSVPIMAMPGELVVPRGMVSSGAVDHLRGSIPGFAAGGIVPSYSGSVAGLPPWTSHNQRATVTAIGVDIAKAMAAAFTGPAGFGGGGFGSAPGSLGTAERAWIGAGGPGGIIAHIAGAITGAESGFDPLAVQKGQPYATTGWGAWQITPGDSEPQFGVNQALLNWHSNALAAVAKYRGAGGSFSPWTTFMDGAYLSFMDQGGYLRPGWNLSYNGTGRPEQVIPHSGGSRGGGQTVIVNVNVGHGTHPVQAAQEIARILNTGAHSGVRLRTSILGPG